MILLLNHREQWSGNKIIIDKKDEICLNLNFRMKDKKNKKLNLKFFPQDMGGFFYGRFNNRFSGY